MQWETRAWDAEHAPIILEVRDDQDSGGPLQQQIGLVLEAALHGGVQELAPAVRLRGARLRIIRQQLIESCTH